MASHPLPEGRGFRATLEINKGYSKKTLLFLPSCAKMRIIMMRIKVMRFLLATALLSGSDVLGNECLDRTNAVLKSQLWARMGRYWSGDQPATIKTIMLDNNTVSQEARNAKAALEAAGGSGRYESVQYREYSAKEFVRVVSPPQNHLYGKAFTEIFRELNVHHIPVFIDPHMEARLLGYVMIDSYGSTDSRAEFFLKQKTNDFVNRHELRHIRDYLTETEDFKQILPDIPDSIVRLLEKKEAGETLTWWNEQRFRATVGIPRSLGEIRAYGESLPDIFTINTLRKIFSREIGLVDISIELIETFSGVMLYNDILLIELVIMNPINSHMPVVAFKALILTTIGAFIIIYPTISLMKLILEKTKIILEQIGSDRRQVSPERKQKNRKKMISRPGATSDV